MPIALVLPTHDSLYFHVADGRQVAVLEWIKAGCPPGATDRRFGRSSGPSQVSGYFLNVMALKSSVCLRMPTSVGKRSMDEAP